MAPTAAVTGPNRSQRKAAGDPIRLWRRWWLRRQGRIDGRLGQPDPTMASGPVATQMRKLLQERLNHQLAVMGSQLVEMVNQRKNLIEELEASLPHIRSHLERARTELAALQAKKPDPGLPASRHLRTLEQSEHINLLRSHRKHREDVKQAEQRVGLLEKEMREAEEAIARADEEIVGLRRAAAEEAIQLQSIMQRELAIYHQALLRRHPRGELLRPVLDLRDPVLPMWVFRYAGPADEPGTAGR